MRETLETLVDSALFRNSIIAVIIANAILLGLETSDGIMARAGALILFLDKLCLGIFIVELLLKFTAKGLRFFQSGWNWFDLIIVGIALLPVGQGLSVLRALRILRVLRLINVVPSLRRVVEGFLSAVPGMVSVFGLMALIFYIAAVMATKLFGSGCTACTPEQAANFDAWFGTLGQSAYSLFQIMTLESWSMGIVRPVMEVYPYAWVFFVPFILLTTFAVVNLVVGLVVNSMQDAHSAEANAAQEAYQAEVLKRLSEIETRLSNRSDTK